MIKINPRAQLAVVLLMCLCLADCAKNAVANTPGAINTFDANAYNTLISVQASLTQAKTLITPTTPPAVRTALNAAGAAYNVAMDAYKTYHAALVAGGTPDSTTLSAQISKLVTDIAAIVAGLKPLPPAPAPVTPGAD